MLRRILLRRKASTVFFFIVILSVILSLALRYGLKNAPISKSEIESLSQLLGYLGALAFFIPVCISMALDYRSRALDVIVNETSDAKSKEQFQDIAKDNTNFSIAFKVKVEPANAVGFFLISIGFALGI